ncbi:MAG TPA: hypothetical protein DD405_05440 [Desulfobacteraceae bacterium]|nr:hypothetical protein [Desulfobacteraceae bacterium]
MTKRTISLKVETPIKAHHTAQVGFTKLEEGEAFRQGYDIKLDLERAKLLTDSYKQTEDKPIPIRRAKAFENILKNMTVFIRDKELLVGNFARDLKSVTHYPELQWRWVEKTTAPGQVYGELLDDGQWEELKDLHKYWQSRAIHGMERQYLPKGMEDAWRFKGEYLFSYHWEHSTPNYEKLFTIGLKGILDEIEQRAEKLNKEAVSFTINASEYADKKIFLDGAKISVSAVVNWIRRYADLAAEKAENENTPERKKELSQIAENCKTISQNPPETFQQALQLYWFIHLLVNFIELPQVGSGIRLDKVTTRFYENDLKEERLTRESAQELVENLYVKFLETGFLHPPIWTGVGGGGLGWQSITIGGVDKNGNDVCSEVTNIILDAMQEIKTVAPPLSFRWHDKLQKKTIDKVIETLASGLSEPAIFNDKMMLQRLMAYGVPIKEARDYSINTCMWWVIPGKNICFRASNSGQFSLPKMLVLALNQGKTFDGIQLSCDSPDPSTFNSLDDIIDAFMIHFRHNLKRLLMVSNIGDELYKKYLPRPFLSSLLDGCIERAQDCRDWVYEPDYRDVMLIGINNVANSLAALKKIIFDDKKATLLEVIDALKNNWEGKEALLKDCLDAPKFGNDDDYVDLICRDISIQLTEEVSTHKTIYGTNWCVDGSAATSPFMLGTMCEATPDGRKDKDPFHDGTISPSMGTDLNGPTATLKSVSKVDPVLAWNQLFNQTFQPEFLKGPYADVFENYLRTFGDLGVHHVQFSIVGKELLQEAQDYPENHPDLLVRVCGYSAYFVDMSRDVQNWLMDRTAQSF